MGKSKAPKAPDPLPAAQATAQANKDVAQYTTALDRPTQIDPYGQTTWTLRPGADPNKPKPGDWTQTTSLNQAQQNLLDKETSAYNKAADMGLGALDQARVAGVGSGHEDLLKGANKVRDLSTPNLGSIKAPTYAGSNTGIPQLANATALPNWQQLDRIDSDPATFQQQGEEVRDALYNQLTRFAGDRYSQEEEALRSQLANQGFAMGSEGYERELERLRRAKNETYESAGLQSVLAGGQEQSRLFGDRLAAQQSNIGLNQAQFDAGATRSQLDLANRLAAFDAGTTRYGLDQSERQAQFANALTGRSFDQSTMQQMFQNQAQASQWDMARRQQSINENLLRRQTPLNEALALAGMGGVQTPQFQPFNMSQPWQGVDYLGVQQIQNQNAMNQANFNAAQRGQTLSTLGTLGMAGATAFA